jgi:hypothetical protein
MPFVSSNSRVYNRPGLYAIRGTLCFVRPASILTGMTGGCIRNARLGIREKDETIKEEATRLIPVLGGPI